MLVGVVLVAGLVSGQFSPSADGGFDTVSETARGARRRVMVVEAPGTLDGTLRVTDSLQARSALALRLLGSAAEPGSASGATISYGSGVRLQQEDEHTLVLGITGQFRFAVDTLLGFARVDERTVTFTSGASALWRVSSSQRIEASSADLSGGQTGTTTELRLELLTVTTRTLGINPAEGRLWGAAMAWDPLRQRLMRFGGASNSSGAVCGSCEDGSTWVLIGSEWVALQLPSPPARTRATLTWDPTRQVMVMFGGSTAGVRRNDTWEFTETGWVERLPVHQPPKRWGHATTWFPMHGRVVLYGGFEGPGLSSDTVYEDLWEWDGTDWVELPSLMGPGVRDSHGLVFDENLGEVLLIGGWDGAKSYGDAWSWNGSRWQLLQFGPLFSKRCSLNVAWDPVQRRVVVVGGWAPEVHFSQFFDDAAAFDQNGWSHAGVMPAIAHRVALASHPTLGVVGFGGKNGAETFGWTLTPASPAWSTDIVPPSRPGGPVSNRLDVVTVMSGTAWRETSSAWRLVGAVPFVSALELVETPFGLVAAAAHDGGVAVWEDRRGWLLVDSASAMSLAADDVNEDVWVARNDGALRVRRNGTWQDGGSFPADAGLLSAVSNGRLFLRGDMVRSFDPVTGSLAPVAPPAFSGEYALRYDPRREVLLASRPGDGSLLEWHGDAWVRVLTAPTASAWSGGPPWKTLTDEKTLATYEPLRALGAACREGRQCASNFCADGVCCESACDGSECVMCSVAAGGEEDGRCTTVRAYDIKRCGVVDVCLSSMCMPGFEACPRPADACAPDAGEPGQYVWPDAGPRPIRRPAVDSSLSPLVCRCSSAEGVFALVALAALFRSRQRR